MSECVPFNYPEDTTWLSDCLQGKFKGLEKAARIYNTSMEQPMYFRLVILELMENLTTDDEILHKNSLWMLSKLVEEQHNYQFMSPTIQILINSLQSKNIAIRYFSLKMVNQILSSYYPQFKDALPQMVSNLKHSNSKIKLLASSIVTQYMEIDPNAMESAIKLLVQGLRDNDIEIREVSIRALLRINQHVDQVVQSIMESFQDEKFRIDMVSHIFNFIKESPVKVLEALRKTLQDKDEKIRENSIIFMHQIAQTKYADSLVKAVPELLDALTDKNKMVHRTAARILYIISKISADSLSKGINKFVQLLKIKNKQLLSYFIFILVQMLKYFPDELNEQMDLLIELLEKTQPAEEIDPEIEIINTISLSTLLRYKNEFARALSLAQECATKYRVEKTIFELHLFIGYTHYYLENYSDAIQAFLKAESAHKLEDYYTATLATLMIAFNFALLRLFDSCLDYKNDAEKYFEQAKVRSSEMQVKKLQAFMDFIKGIADQNFKNAQSNLISYQTLDPFKNLFDRNLNVIDIKNAKKVEKFFEESQQIRAELEKNTTNREAHKNDDI